MADNNQNPANSESTLFRRLTRLFSGPIVTRKTQMIRNQRRQDLDKFRFKSASGQNFKKTTYNNRIAPYISQFSNGSVSSNDTGPPVSEDDDWD